MLTFISYQLKVAVVLIAFYLCFKCFLSRERMHGVNRAVILLTAALSFVLPLCVITVHRTLIVPQTAVPEIIGGTETGGPDIIGAAVGESGIIEAAAGVPWETLAIIVFWLGAICVFGRIALGIWRVTRLIRKGGRKQLHGREVIVCGRDIPPFSWMRWIVMSRTDFGSGNRHILEHEKAHIRLGHSIDVLVFDLMSAFQWFNPAMWLLRRELRAIHEYEADDAVLRSGVDIREYQYSLIRKAAGASGYSITNSFNHSILKNRITMMSKSNASVMRGLRALYILPLICGALALNARTVTDCEVSENSSIPTSEDGSGIQIEVKKGSGGEIQYYIRGENIGFDELPSAVKSLVGEDKEAKVEIYAPSDVWYKYIKEIADQLRGISVLKFQYTCPGVESVDMRLPTDKEAAEQAGIRLIDTMDAVQAVPKERRHFLFINSKGRILYDKSVLGAEDNLTELVAASIRTDHQYVIFVRMDIATPYGAYVKMQKCLNDALGLVRDEYSRERFGRVFEELDAAGRAAVAGEIPLSICEIAPKTSQRR